MSYPDTWRLVWLHVDDRLFAAVISTAWVTTTRVLYNGRSVPWSPFVW